MSYITHDPNADLVYGFQWVALAGLTLRVNEWTVTPTTGITVTNLGATDLGESGIVTKLRVSGGTLGQTYRLTNHVEGDDGETFFADDRSHVIRIAER